MGASGKSLLEPVKCPNRRTRRVFCKRNHSRWRKEASSPPRSSGVDAALMKKLTGKPRSFFRLNQLKIPRRPRTSKRLQSEAQLPKFPSKRRACHSTQGKAERQKGRSSSALKARISLAILFEKENFYVVIPSSYCERMSIEAVGLMNTQIIPALGKIRKRVMCYTCGKCVREKHFQDHLFFGKIECTKCKIKILKCDTFRNSISCQLMYADCTHQFIFCSDPATYILAMLQDPFDSPALKSTINDRMSSYISSLEDLAKKEPWKQAVSQCQRYLKGEETTKSKQNNPELIELEDNDLQLDNSEIIEIKEESLQLNDSEPKILFSIPKFEIETPSRSQDYPTQDDLNGFVLSQSYNLDYMDDTVTYQFMPAGIGKSPLENPKEGSNTAGSIVSSIADSFQPTESLIAGIDASVTSTSTMTESNDSWERDIKTPENSSVSVASTPTRIYSTDSCEIETETQESSSTLVASSSTMSNSSRSWERETMSAASTSNMSDNTDYLKRKAWIPKTLSKLVTNGPPMTKVRDSLEREVESSNVSRKQGADNSPRRENVYTDNSKVPKITNAPRALKTTGTLRHKFIKIPSTRPYFVIRDPIEECPMCYTDVCPTRFQLKFNNRILASECVGCGLAFYIVIAPLNESFPKISIITGDLTEEVMKPKSKKRGKDYT